MKRPLTSRQQEWLAALLEAIVELGRPPTCRELAERMGTRHPSAAVETLRALEKKGWIHLGGAGKARAIRLVGRRCSHCGGIGVVP